MKLSKRLTNTIACFLLLFVFLICLFSMKDDSATMDELAHLPAGFSYLTQQDMRLNPEHPPLIKDLAALPILFIKGIKFPENIKAWQSDINGQWEFGSYFLYKIGNPAERILFLARIPMVLVLIALGFYVFKWAKELSGNKVALLALFLFSFSPTLLAHGRLVTTDVGATAGIFIATYYFLKALKVPTKRNIFLAGISFGLAQLAKFTTFLLVPFFGFLVIVWIVLKENKGKRDKLKLFGSYILRFLVILGIGFFIVWAFYLFHVLNYPPERQARDIEFLLSSHPIRFLGPLLGKCAKVPIVRAIVQYLFGLALVYQRAIGGHTTYFLGEVSAAGWKNYFPIVYLIKEPLTFHILSVLALFLVALKIKRPFWQDFPKRSFCWIRNHFPEFSMISFVLLYWILSLTSHLNIGVRHLLPVFPFTILLVSRSIGDWLKPPYLKLKYFFLTVLICWQIISVLSIYPHFLAYFNEIVGVENGYLYTVNSNLDWGQDLKRLTEWVAKNNIEKIYVDYFGGGDAKYYLKEKFMPWWGTRPEKEFEKPNYLAVSVTFLQGGRGRPAPGFDQPSGYYLWLNKYTPVAKIGYSIFVYYIE